MINLKSIFIKVLILFIILISLHCDTTEPPNKGSLSLTLEEVSCTEAWLTLKAIDIPLPTSVILKQNDITRTTLTLATSDTLLYIDSLLPNKTYTFQVSSIQHLVSSSKANATTLDTTSHSFTWQTWTFGEHSSSVLYDVAIINENNIWAVGAIYMNDSLGNPDPHAYNAVHWDGNEWKLMRIFFSTVCGSTSVTAYPAKAIFEFDDGQIWISSSGDKIAILQGGVQIDEFCLPSNVSMSINKLWGSSSNDLFAVGNGGNIAHYQSGVWTKIESGTNVDIQDIWGIGIESTNENLILCAASNAIEPGERKILRIGATKNVDTIGWLSDRRVHSVWMDSKYQLFACGDGIFINSFLSLWKKQEELTFVFTERIRGNSGNDVFVVGDFGLIAHYNGLGWKEYPEASAALVYTSLDMRNNLMITVGYTQRRAVIQKMIRN